MLGRLGAAVRLGESAAFNRDDRIAANDPVVGAPDAHLGGLGFGQPQGELEVRTLVLRLQLVLVNRRRDDLIVKAGLVEHGAADGAR